MNKIYYSQVDSRWVNYPYPSPNLPNATIGSGGCGVACAAMIVSMLKQIILPTEMANKFLKDGIRLNGGTSNKAFDSYLTKQYGLKMKKNWKLDDAVECLKKGGLVVARCVSQNGTLFTTGGHFIVFVGYKDGVIEVYDPYLYSTKFSSASRKGKATISGTSVFVTYDNMKAYGGYNELWCYEPTKIDTNKDDEKIKSTKEIKYNRGTVGKNKILSKNCKLYSKPNLTGTRYDYLKNTAVIVLENTNANIDKVKAVKTGRIAYINISNYNDYKETTQKVRVMTVTAKSGLNVRAGAGTKYKIVTCYKYGTKVNVYSTINGWAKGTKGYMSLQYLK